MRPIAPTLQAFFTDRLAMQRQVSPRIVISHRGSLKPLLGFAQNRPGKAPTYLDRADLDADLVAALLDHLENDRHNSPRTRNLRLAAIRSLFAFAALRHPEHAELIQRVLAVPDKRFDKQLITFLTAAEIDARVDASDTGRWEGRRDRAVLLLAAPTGLRASELTAPVVVVGGLVDGQPLEDGVQGVQLANPHVVVVPGRGLWHSHFSISSQLPAWGVSYRE